MATWHVTKTVPRRPQVGCCHGRAAKPEREAQNEAVARLFLEAVDLLPVDEMPVLLKCVVGGGACFGLLDPVANIVLSAVSYLDRLEHPLPEELARRGRMTVEEQQREASKNRIMEHVDMEFFQKIGLRFAAGRSRNGLTVFLENYFRYLTKPQAARYLELAGFDLALAVQLVHHDSFVLPCAIPDPSSYRTQAALKLAAHEAGLWAPEDDFVLLATSRYPRDLLEKATARLLMRGKRKLRRSDIDMMRLLMRWRSDGCPDEGDLNLAHLTVLRRPEDVPSMTTVCLEPAPSLTRSPSYHTFSSSSSSCEYQRYLKLSLLDSIHVFYLEALARLPREALRRHLRGILVAGHCYGPLDPVSNIILNAIWYDMAFPLEVGEQEEADVLDNKCFLRMERRSLDGLVALCSDFLSASHSHIVSEHKALEFLCYKNCHPCIELYESSDIVHFRSAASAARHPQPIIFGKFLKSLYPQVVVNLMYLLECAGSKITIAYNEIQQLYDMIRAFLPKENPRWPVCNLSSQAWKLLAERRKTFKVEQLFIRKVINVLLHKYNTSHPEEPGYNLHVICGVSASTTCYGSICYHINFLVTTSCQSSGCLLFFSEFFGYCQPNEELTVSFFCDESRPSFCCPVSMTADLGRCCHCEMIASRIVHPVSRSYFSNRGKDSTESFRVWNSFDEYGIDVDQMLESDFIYFDQTRDGKLAHSLNVLGAKKD